MRSGDWDTPLSEMQIERCYTFSMEIEAKFTVPDSDIFTQLQGLKTLGAYTLKEPSLKLITDSYIDTDSGLLRQAGFACRLRHDHTRSIWIGAVKGLGGAEDGLHQREEFEVPIMPNAPVRNWPRSEARDRALALSQGQAFTTLFSLRQVRHLSNIYHEGVRVAELSLDQVTLTTTDETSPALELEIELKGKGTRDDLRALTEALAEYKLTPEPQSKFERAYAANVSIIK